MEARELRIGNLVYRLERKLIKESNVENIQQVKVIHVFNISDYNSLTLFEPIPLTEEWLIRASVKGFSVKGELFISDYKLFQLHPHMDIRMYPDAGICFFWKSELIYEHKELSVNKLQNIYYELTHQELVFRENIFIS